MKLPEFVIVFGIFIIIFYSLSSFFMNFGIRTSVPSEIMNAWNASMNQLNQANSVLNSTINQIRRGGLEAVVGVFGLAFSGIYYIIVNLYSVFVTIPSAIKGAIEYLGASLGVPSFVINTIISIIIAITIIKLIEFVSGRTIP